MQLCFHKLQDQVQWATCTSPPPRLVTDATDAREPIHLGRGCLLREHEATHTEVASKNLGVRRRVAVGNFPYIDLLKKDQRSKYLE